MLTLSIRRFTIATVGLFALALTVACQGQAGAPDADDPVAITIEPDGNNMSYAETEFTVAPGQTVELTFSNTATSSAMVHNVVILNTLDNEVADRVGMAGMQAGEEHDFIPEDEAILAHTPLAQPGETVEVEFTAPDEPGEYRYLCTFPGHSSMMRGTMVVSTE